MPWRPGPAYRNADLGYDEEADEEFTDSGESEEPSPDDLASAEQGEESAPPVEKIRRLAMSDLLGSRAPLVLLRLERVGDEVKVRTTCAAPASSNAEKALELLERFVQRCFKEGRASFPDPTEWDRLLGFVPAPLTQRLLLLLRLAVEAKEKVSLSEDNGTAFTPKDIGLDRFAAKFVALPDGTPFSIRLLLLDKRGQTSTEDSFFDELPDAIKLLALRKTLAREAATRVAVSDNDFRTEIQTTLKELLGTRVPKPTEDQVRRRLRDNFKRKGLENLFPNQKERQREYDEDADAPSTDKEQN
jgi:hypothetical protein